MAKRHGWLTGALSDGGYQQHDLARAWKVDDAVVSRFISSGKPDLTPERLMILSQILGISNDELLTRLFGDKPLPRIIPLKMQQAPAQQAQASRPQLPPQRMSHDKELIEDEVRQAVEQLQNALPGATITITISYDRRR